MYVYQLVYVKITIQTFSLTREKNVHYEIERYILFDFNCNLFLNILITLSKFRLFLYIVNPFKTF